MSPFRNFVRLAVMLALTLVGASVLGPALSAQESMRTSPYTRSAFTEPRVEDGKLQLSLEEAIIIALRNNIGLHVNRYRRAESWEQIRMSQGIFDLGLTITSGAFSETSPSATAIDGALIQHFEGQNLDLRIDQLISSGALVSVDWTNARQESNSSFASVNPSFRINMDLIFSQPLMRGFGSNATKRNIILARNNSGISVETLRLQAIDTVQLVEETYWTLAEAKAQLGVALESLALAENLHEMNVIQVEVGTLAPLELTQSRVGIATREEAVLRAEVLIGDTEDRLRQSLNFADGPLWDTEIVPTSQALIDRIEINVEAAIQTGFASRAELRQQMLRNKNLDVDREFQKNLARPRLDFQARYGFNGLGGDVVIFENFFDPNSPRIHIPGGYDDSLEQITEGRFEGWNAGIVFAYPFQNRAGKAAVAIADLAYEEGQSTLQDLRLAIKTDVRRAARAVKTAAEAIDLALITRELEEQNLDAEGKRYENGLSTTYQVLEIQEDLSAAQSRYVGSIGAYRRALVLYFKTIGKLLEENDIVLEDDYIER